MNALACASAPGFSIDPEFSVLCPAQTEDEIEKLTRLILEDGIRDPLVVWDEAGLLLDGHTRLGIAEQNKLTFTVVRKSFLCREDAHDWIINNQLARRNMSEPQKAYLLGKLYRSKVSKPGGKRPRAGAPPTEATPGTIKERRQNRPDGLHNQMPDVATIEQPDEICPVLDSDKRTCDAVARQYGVSPNTVQTAGKFSEAVDFLDANSPGRKEEILKSAKVSKSAVIREAERLAAPEVDNQPKLALVPPSNDQEQPPDLVYRAKVLWSRLEGRRRNDFVSVYRQLNLLQRGDFWSHVFETESE